MQHQDMHGWPSQRPTHTGHRQQVSSTQRRPNDRTSSANVVAPASHSPTLNHHQQPEWQSTHHTNASVATRVATSNASTTDRVNSYDSFWGQNSSRSASYGIGVATGVRSTQARRTNSRVGSGASASAPAPAFTPPGVGDNKFVFVFETGQPKDASKAKESALSKLAHPSNTVNAPAVNASGDDDVEMEVVLETGQADDASKGKESAAKRKRASTAKVESDNSAPPAKKARRTRAPLSRDNASLLEDAVPGIPEAMVRATAAPKKTRARPSRAKKNAVPVGVGATTGTAVTTAPKKQRVRASRAKKNAVPTRAGAETAVPIVAEAMVEKNAVPTGAGACESAVTTASAVPAASTMIIPAIPATGPPLRIWPFARVPSSSNHNMNNLFLRPIQTPLYFPSIPHWVQLPPIPVFDSNVASLKGKEKAEGSGSKRMNLPLGAVIRNREHQKLHPEVQISPASSQQTTRAVVTKSVAGIVATALASITAPPSGSISNTRGDKEATKIDSESRKNQLLDSMVDALMAIVEEDNKASLELMEEKKKASLEEETKFLEMFDKWVCVPE